MKRAALLALLFLPAAAQAHLVSTGIGPFYDGLAHLFLSAQDLLFSIGLGLLAGLSGRAVARPVLLSGAVVWLAGGIVGLQAEAIVSLAFASPLMLLAVGIMVALDLRVPLVVTVTLTTAAAAIHGFLNGTALAPLGLVGVLGLYSAFFVVVLLSSAAVTGLRELWMITAVRVAGSWIGAVGLLLLGWSIRPVLG